MGDNIDNKFYSIMSTNFPEWINACSIERAVALLEHWDR